MEAPTYKCLFKFLLDLGFEDCSNSQIERVFEHPATETLVAFSMIAEAREDGPVRGSDLTSVEIRLVQIGLLGGSLNDALREFWKTQAT